MHRNLIFLRWLAAVLIFTTSSCKRNMIEQVEVLPPASKSLSLTMAHDPGSRLVSLRWSKYQGISFSRYQVRRSVLVHEGASITQQIEILANLSDVSTLRYEDEVPPNALMAHYTIEAVWSETNIPAYSNPVEAKFDAPFVPIRGDVKLDVLLDAETETVYLIDRRQGAISAFSLAENRLVASDTIHRELGYGTFGKSEGTAAKALYLPTSDGWLHIVNPVTLVTEKRLFLEELGISSVIVSGQSIIAATNNGTYGGKVKVYDRSSHLLVDQVEYHSYLSLFALPTNPRSFFSVTHNLIPTELTRFELADDGAIASITEDNYHGDHPIRHEIVSISPEGSRFVSTGMGSIYKANLTHELTLHPWSYQNPPYGSYAFNEDGTLLYAASTGEQTIDQLSLPDGTVVQKFATAGKPFQIFKNGDHLIVVNEIKTDTWPVNRHYFIEKISL